MATDAELMGELDAGTYFKSHVTLNLDELRDLEGVIAKFGNASSPLPLVASTAHGLTHTVTYIFHRIRSN